MPEETKTEPTKPENNDQAIIDKITAGVTAGVSAAMPKVVESLKPASTPAPVRTEPAVTLRRPTEEEIAQATIDGNKDLLAKLLRDQRAADLADQNRALGNITSQGGAAIGSIAKNAAANLPFYKRFKKEIDEMVDGYVAANPGVIPTYDMYERAHSIVKGNHTDELIDEAREEAIRKSREPAPDLTPEGRAAGAPEQREPKTLAEELAGDWRQEFRAKQRGVGGRSDEEELRKAGYKGFDDFIKQRRVNQPLAEATDGGMNLDRDWACKAHGRKFCTNCARSGAEGEWIN